MSFLQDGIAAAFGARDGQEGSVEGLNNAILGLSRIGTPEAFAKQDNLDELL